MGAASSRRTRPARRGFTRRGFTLIELLVVIAIMGVLLAMLLPAAQKVREAAVLTQCQNNLHQLGVALHNYHSQNGWFPPARGLYSTDPATDLLLSRGWMTELMPYVEQSAIYADLWGKYDRPVPAFACPMDPRVATTSSTGWGLTSYVGVTGSDDDWYRQAYVETNGIFNIASTNGRGTRVTDITDGSANTLMVGERPPSQDEWWGMWFWSDYDNLLSTRQQFTFDNTNSLNFACNFPGVFSPGRLDGPCNGDSNHFWSLHTGGGNWLFGDGAVRFLSYGGAALTIPLATRAGKEVIPDDY